MAAVYVHIGMEKTGTSAIQHFLVRNRDILREHGAVYPKFDLTYDWVHKDINGYWLMQPENGFGPGKKCIKKVNRLAKQFDTVILSAECLWNRQGWRPEFWQELRRLLDPDIQLKVIAYVRRQDAYIYSHWSQQVKSQNPDSIEAKPFRECIADGEYRDNRLDYQAYFQDIIPVLGEENIILRVYEKTAFRGGSIFADFLDAAGLRMDDTFRQLKNRQNEGLKGSVLETKRLLNAMPEFTGREYLLFPYLSEVQKQLAEEGTLSERSGFLQKEREDFLRSYRESNAWTARTLLGREDGVLFYEPVPADDALAGTDYTTEEIARVCGYVLLDLLAENRDLAGRLAALRRPDA